MSSAPTDERPVRIYLNVLGARRELVLPGYGWTYAEAKLAKSVSGGMAPVEIGQGFLNADPDAVMAIIRVTLAREGHQPSTAEITQLAELNLEEVAQAAMTAFEAASGGNGASPTVPATAGESTSPAGRSTSSDDDSPDEHSKPGAPLEHESTSTDPPTATPASVASGPPSSDTS